MKPRVGIFGLSGCWGEQIVILNCEDQLLDIVGAVEIVDFLGGSSVNDEEGKLDVAFVEGSVGSEIEVRVLKRIRERAGVLVACGTCACCGGVAAMDADRPRERIAEAVYGSAGRGFDLHVHEPLHKHVKVDFRLVGCPMEKDEFLRLVSHVLVGDAPLAPTTPVCHECKMAERDCLLLSAGLPCTGAVTAGGCGARCPGYRVPCIGCRGPVDEANQEAMLTILREKNIDERLVRRKLRTFAAPVLDGLAPGPTRST